MKGSLFHGLFEFGELTADQITQRNLQTKMADRMDADV